MYNTGRNSYGTVSHRNLGLYFSSGTIIVCVVVIAITVASSVSIDDQATMDVSGGRGIVLGLSVVFLTAAAFVLRQCRIEGASKRAGTGAEGDTTAEVQSAEIELPVEAESDASLITTLPDDEQRLYRMLADAGGEMLQMHVVSSGAFSKAKVTRLLDKLENRGLVVRERHGMTNRIRVIR